MEKLTAPIHKHNCDASNISPGQCPAFNANEREILDYLVNNGLSSLPSRPGTGYTELINLDTPWNADQVNQAEEILAFCARNDLRDPNDLCLLDGAKATLLPRNNAPSVLKIYRLPASDNDVYSVEKQKYDKLDQLGLTSGDNAVVVPHYNWNPVSRTCEAARLDRDENGNTRLSRDIEEASLINDSLTDNHRLRFYDIMNGDNIGYYQGKRVVFDVKSLGDAG